MRSIVEFYPQAMTQGAADGPFFLTTGDEPAATPADAQTAVVADVVGAGTAASSTSQATDSPPLSVDEPRNLRATARVARGTFTRLGQVQSDRRRGTTARGLGRARGGRGRGRGRQLLQSLRWSDGSEDRSTIDLMQQDDESEQRGDRQRSIGEDGFEPMEEDHERDDDEIAMTELTGVRKNQNPANQAETVRKERTRQISLDLEEDPHIYVDALTTKRTEKQAVVHKRIQPPPLPHDEKNKLVEKNKHADEPEEAVRNEINTVPLEVQREAERLFKAYLRSQQHADGEKWTPFTQPTQSSAVKYQTLLARNPATFNYSGAMSRRAPYASAASDSEEDTHEVAAPRQKGGGTPGGNGHDGAAAGIQYAKGEMAATKGHSALLRRNPRHRLVVS